MKHTHFSVCVSNHLGAHSHMHTHTQALEVLYSCCVLGLVVSVCVSAALSTKCLLESHSKLQTPALFTVCVCVCEYRVCVCVCEHGIVNTHSARGNTLGAAAAKKKKNLLYTDVKYHLWVFIIENTLSGPS